MRVPDEEKLVAEMKDNFAAFCNAMQRGDKDEALRIARSHAEKLRDTIGAEAALELVYDADPEEMCAYAKKKALN